MQRRPKADCISSKNVLHMFFLAGDVAERDLGLSQTPFVSSAVETCGGRSTSLDFARDERVDLKSSPERGGFWGIGI